MVLAAADAAGIEREDLVLVLDHDLVVQADARLLQEALERLLVNARVHGSMPVTVTGRSRAESVELAITDEGPGLRPAFAASAFERFTRNAPASTPGMGVGLAIVQSIVDTHHATVSYRSHGDGGSFVVCFARDGVLHD